MVIEQIDSTLLAAVVGGDWSARIPNTDLPGCQAARAAMEKNWDGLTVAQAAIKCGGYFAFAGEENGDQNDAARRAVHRFPY
jgi:hypothetical protein